MKTIEIAGRTIGLDRPVFVIAEVGVNHNGQAKLAKHLVDIAIEAGADAVKFQTFKSDRLVGPSAAKAEYQKRTTSPSESQAEMLTRLELSEGAFREIRDHCHARGILFLSTPFDEESVDFLDGLDVPAFKVSSGDLTNWPLLEHIAAKNKPIILSTGMSSLAEIDEAIRRILSNHCVNIALLQCVSEYPVEASRANLRVIETLTKCYRIPVGLSDHSMGLEIAIASVALGARIIEKHFTIDRTLPGPDHQASLEPHELKLLVRSIRNVEAALGDGVKNPTIQEVQNAVVVRRSLTADVSLEPGQTLARSMIILKRPGTGLPAAALPYILGRRVRCRVEEGTILELGMFE